MKCAHCGAENEDGLTPCRSCGTPRATGAATSWIDIVPPLVMASGSLVSALWLSTGQPALYGDLTYPLLFSYAFVLGGAVFSLRKKGDRFLLTWGACALATLYAITAKSFGSTDYAATSSGIVSLAAFVGVFVSLVIGVAIGRVDARRSALFVGLYFAWAVTDGPSIPGEGVATTALISTITIAESIILVWVIDTYGKLKIEPALSGIIGLLIAHPYLVGWQTAIGVEPGFTWGQYFIDSLVQGLGFVIFINAILIVFILLVRKLTHEV